ncbi:MAG: hypothetical protein HOD97_04125 [Candidatus Marinimicrobia bacterium]|jgi:MFS superfamily sulfate permease-like transporter|nr:hypothetical protein [Candidatus Neomarinimicrobiota bacterium]MBT3617907.1 hypothetical protein [Candidatus Neomarinimicrobiota bacterium]MBT3828744.1 hypothetical protein [Candidatus Neomarinimicrobiota bacterium]MBT3997035.1 hypothetical protein [Candidatus Neomarinimicrobiota bacterium]MBT4280791.1 hypothetical protein [Candidatus Neomarinimicrobiota bacterium]
MKEIGTYLIIGGIALFILVFFGKIFSFIFENPLLGVAFIAIAVGIVLLLLSIAREKKNDEKKEDFRGIKQ